MSMTGNDRYDWFKGSVDKEVVKAIVELERKNKMPEFVDVVPESDPKQGKWEAALAPCIHLATTKEPWLILRGIKKTSAASMIAGQTKLPDGRPPSDFEFKKVRNNALPKGEIDLYVRFVG